jgi:Symplekin tight junction protein C terminal
MLQQLAGVVPTPKLLFRLVLLVLQRHPVLSNFVIDLLSSFINKKVWTDNTLWEGFIKCCEVGIPYKQTFELMYSLCNTHTHTHTHTHNLCLRVSLPHACVHTLLT